MGNPALQIVQSIQRMACTGCGAEANVSCNCGKPYVPKSERAAEAIKANPEKSDRAIAAELGVSPMTVNRARATVPDVTVDERIGLDGKTRRVPEKKPEAEPEIDNDNHNDADDPDAEVADSEVVKTNLLDTVSEQLAMASAYKKVLKRSFFDFETRGKIIGEIDKLIGRWKSARRVVLNMRDPIPPTDEGRSMSGVV